MNETVLETKEVSAWYGELQVLKDISLQAPRQKITAIIGPSGCGKSTLIRCFNRLNDLIPSFRIKGKILFNNQDIYGDRVDPTYLRYRIGMVFQKPNPFPKSIYENVAFGLRINSFHGNLKEAVEKALIKAALWNEVKDRLDKSALTLSGGQQQRLCIARALALEPEVLLMDEPCSALDPIATITIEELMRELAKNYTILIVTHNMQQAARISDYTAVLLSNESRIGELAEFGPTSQVFTNPRNPRAEAYITGKFG